MSDFASIGESKARELFGDKRYDVSRTNAPAGRRRDLIGLADSVVFGQVYPRPGLTPQQRSLSTVAALTALGQLTQLRAHVNGALNVGVTEEEIAEVITQMAMYAGFPAALNAMQVADECFDAVTTEREK